MSSAIHLWELKALQIFDPAWWAAHFFFHKVNQSIPINWWEVQILFSSSLTWTYCLHPASQTCPTQISGAATTVMFQCYPIPALHSSSSSRPFGWFRADRVSCLPQFSIMLTDHFSSPIFSQTIWLALLTGRWRLCTSCVTWYAQFNYHFFKSWHHLYTVQTLTRVQ